MRHLLFHQLFRQLISDRLRIGMAAKLTIIEKEKKNVLSLPGNVIQMKNDTDGTVTVISPDGTEREVAVKIGMKTDYYVEVISDTLKEGDQVRVVSDDTDLSSLETMGGLG